MRRVIPAILLVAFAAIGFSSPSASALTITDPASVSGNGTDLIYGYDGMGRLNGVSDGALGKFTSCQYNGRGQRVLLQAANVPDTTYVSDVAGRPLLVTRGANSAAMSYDLAGRHVATALPNGVATAYSYDPADRLTAVTHVQGGNTVAGASYLLDDAGQFRGSSGDIVQNPQKPEVKDSDQGSGSEH